MNPEYSQKRFSEALALADNIVFQLGSMRGQPWVGYFERLKSALEENDAEAAVRARGTIPFGTMGGFGEFLEANPEIQAIYNELSELVGDLKLYSRYGVTRERH